MDPTDRLRTWIRPTIFHESGRLFEDLDSDPTDENLKNLLQQVTAWILYIFDICLFLSLLSWFREERGKVSFVGAFLWNSGPAGLGTLTQVRRREVWEKTKNHKPVIPLLGVRTLVSSSGVAGNPPENMRNRFRASENFKTDSFEKKSRDPEGKIRNLILMPRSSSSVVGIECENKVNDASYRVQNEKKTRRRKGITRSGIAVDANGFPEIIFFRTLGIKQSAPSV